jgi:mono/diheme cytochrome c family protein
MSFVRRHTVPLAAACAAAAAALAVVALTAGDGGDGGRVPADGRVAARSVPEGQDAGLAVFTRLGCGSCHRLAAAGSAGPIGPNLDERLPSHTRESLTAVILRPPVGSPMPQGFGARMDEAQFDALLDFLLAQREPQ